MRDGVRIALRIYRPEGAGAHPTLFAVSPYRYDNDDLPAYPLFLWRETGPIEWYVEHGYAYVHADTRGTGYSEGEYGFLDRAEQNDLCDVIEWIAEQPWSNGRVGGIGQSYYAMSQWFMGIVARPTWLASRYTMGWRIRTASSPIRAVSRATSCPTGTRRAYACRTVFPPTASIRAGCRAISPSDARAPALRRLLARTLGRRAAARDQRPAALDRRVGEARPAPARQHPGLRLARGPSGWPSPPRPPRLVDARLRRRAVPPEVLLPFYERFLKGAENGFERRSAVTYSVKNTGDERDVASWPPPATGTKTCISARSERCGHVAQRRYVAH